MKKKFFFMAFSGILMVFLGRLGFEKYEAAQKSIKKTTFRIIKKELKQNILENNHFPTKIQIFDKTFRVDFTLQQDLTTYIKKLVKRHKSDYSAIIVLENATGNILSAVGYEKANNSFNSTIPFTMTHPSASLFKIITSASLLEGPSIEETTPFRFRGKRTTLYRYQLKDKKTKWDREVSLKQAFAFSNNVIFARAALKNLAPEDILKTAEAFGFNRKLMEAFPLPPSKFAPPTSDYHLAELASGFNRETLMSPVHAAILSSVVANEGFLVRPKLVKRIFDEKENKDFYASNYESQKVIGKDVSEDLQTMMEYAVKRGAARGIWRNFSLTLKKYLKVGAKTGSITGGKPFGKREWITLYAMPSGVPSDKGISICIMNVNVKKWYTKASFLAKKIISYYYRNITPIAIAKAKRKNEV